MTLCTYPTVGMRPQIRERRPGRPPSGKRLAMVSREMPAKVRSAFRRSLDPCDNSNDSGLGFDHHSDPQHMGMSDRVTWGGDRAEIKRPRLDIKLEQDERLIRTLPSATIPPTLNVANNQSTSTGRSVPRCLPLSTRQSSSTPVSLTTQLHNVSRYMDINLRILKQPEQQHRARYQTEGSRGAVKDREGNGFPVVQLTGYYQPTTLQVFIGTDVGKVAPHMFYQACKVSGKNSTPCIEKKIDGTCVIELQLDPSKEMSATCDCVGILKERNVDVEHRFPDQLASRSKKKSTRCRMIFRTTITHDDGTIETLQVCSQPIVCTQPPGVPEICKRSLTSCPASGGLELFVLGKNFLKDTKVYFQQIDDDRHIRWEQVVVPDKEYLQQTHFVCVIPPYRRTDITEPVTVRLCVVSSGKTSESHQFVYTPLNGAIPSVHVDSSLSPQQHQQHHHQQLQQSQQSPFFNKLLWQSNVNKREQDMGIMPPPESSMVPMTTRRSSLSIPSTSDLHSPPIRVLKQEYIDENSQSSVVDTMDIHQDQQRYRHVSESSLDVNHGDSNLSMINDNSMDMMHNPNNMITNENTNENSVDVMVRRNSMSNSLNVNLNNTQQIVANGNSLNTAMHCSNSVVTDRLVLSQSSMMQNILAASSSTSPQSSSSSSSSSPSSSSSSSLNHRTIRTAEDLKVMDLRMKMPMATVADLVNSTAPSMATLQSFGVTEASNTPLPAQSAQSVESFLTNIESKPSSLMTPTELQLKNEVSEKINQIINNQRNLLTTTSNNLVDHTEPVYLSSQRSFLSSTTTQNEVMQIVAKSEAAAIAEQTMPEQTTATPIARTITTTINNNNNLPTSLETVANQINTSKLDDLVNSTVESHMGSPTRSDQTKDTLSIQSQRDVLITSRDVMLNSRPTLMVPPIINTALQSPIMSQSDLNHSHTSPNLSPEVILNSQISPSLMCRNQDATLMPTTICQTNNTVDTNLLPVNQQTVSTLSPNNNLSTLDSPLSVNNPLGIVATTEPENVVLLEAAVDLLKTQKKLSELDHSLSSQLQGNNFVQTQFTNVVTTATTQVAAAVATTTVRSPIENNTTIQQQQQDNKSDFVIPVPVKEMAGVNTSAVAVVAESVQDKKNEDRMIPQSFTSLTENELINLINPSCFDQV